MSFKIIRNMIVGLLISILVGTALIISVYMLPVDGIRTHVKNSIPLIAATGDRMGGIANDYSLLIATYKKSDSVINDAMMNPRIEYSGKHKLQSLHISLDDENSEPGEVMNYSRYWHGYLIFLKPLLMITSYFGLVNISFLLQFILFVIVILKIYEKFNKIYSFAFALIIFMWHPISLIFCHELSYIYYITLITILIMLSKNEKLNEGGKYYYLFMFNGILVAYFDFLTYPLAALGLPTIFYLLLNENKFTLIKKFFNMIKFALSWSFGYVGMWAGKWCMASMLTDYNTIADALQIVLMKLNGYY